MVFVHNRPKSDRGEYKSLLRTLHRRYGGKPPPATIRRQLGLLKQIDEDLDEFADKVRAMAIDAYPKREGYTSTHVEKLAVEAFLAGVKDRFAALMVSN